MSNRRKNAQNCWFFGTLFPLSSPSMLMNGFIKAAFILFGNSNCFLEHELILFGTRIVHELFMNCSEINEALNETINGH